MTWDTDWVDGAVEVFVSLFDGVVGEIDERNLALVEALA